MTKAIGMVETYGLIYAIEALDVMVKTANVELLSQEFVTGGIVTVTVEGDVGAVQSSVEAGKARVLEMQGKLLSAHVIPRVDSSVHDVMFDSKKVENVDLKESKPVNKKTSPSKAKKSRDE